MMMFLKKKNFFFQELVWALVWEGLVLVELVQEVLEEVRNLIKTTVNVNYL